MKLNMKSFSVTNFFGTLFILLALFPWVSLRTNTMDTQPWFFLMGFVFLALGIRLKFPPKYLLVFLFGILAVISAYINLETINFLVIRGVASYFIFSLSMFAFLVFSHRYGLPVKIIVLANLIYLAFAVLQFFFGDYVVDWAAPIRTTSDRGLTSLAVEPTYFGITLFFISWYYFIVFNYKLTVFFKALQLLNVLAIIFLAQSAMALVFLLVAAFFYLMCTISLKKIVLIFISCAVLITTVSFILPDSRLLKVVSLMFIDGPLLLISADASINYRVASVLYPIHASALNLFLPGGFTAYSDLAGNLYEVYNGFFWYGSHEKIMSFLGAISFELGFFGWFALCCVIYMALNGTRKRIVEIFLLVVFTNSAIPISYPLISFIFAAFIVSDKNFK